MEPRRRYPFRRPPPPPVDPYAYEERYVEEYGPGPRRPLAENPFFWLALLGVVALLIALIVLLAQAADDDGRDRTVTVGAAVVRAVGGPED